MDQDPKKQLNKRLRIVFITLLVVIMMCAAGGLLAYRWIYASFLVPPGQGPKAEAGYAACQPVIEALAAYHAQQGSYPERLEALAPTYLAEIPSSVNEMGIDYSRTDQGYSLAFSYVGPGMNRCTYTPQAGWDCSGYY